MMVPEELVVLHYVLHDGGWCQVWSQQVEGMGEAAIGNQVSSSSSSSLCILSMFLALSVTKDRTLHP